MEKIFHLITNDFNMVFGHMYITHPTNFQMCLVTIAHTRTACTARARIHVKYTYVCTFNDHNSINDSHITNENLNANVNVNINRNRIILKYIIYNLQAYASF